MKPHDEFEMSIKAFQLDDTCHGWHFGKVFFKSSWLWDFPLCSIPDHWAKSLWRMVGVTTNRFQSSQCTGHLLNHHHHHQQQLLQQPKAPGNPFNQSACICIQNKIPKFHVRGQITGNHSQSAVQLHKDWTMQFKISQDSVMCKVHMISCKTTPMSFDILSQRKEPTL